MTNRSALRQGLQRISGFTLVELLLVLTLMSMLLALAYGGLRASTRAADKGQAILEDSSRIRMAHQFVRKQLNQIAPLAFAENEDQSERTVFVGEAGRIRFVAPMPGYLGFGGPQVQELAFVAGENGLSLVLSHALLQGFAEENLYEREPIVLVDEIDSGEFSFLTSDEEGNLTGWVTAWEDGSFVPEAVSLDIEFSEDVYIQWPLLTAALRVTDATAGGSLTPALQGGKAGYSNAIQDMIKRRKDQQ